MQVTVFKNFISHTKLVFLSEVVRVLDCAPILVTVQFKGRSRFSTAKEFGSWVRILLKYEYFSNLLISHDDID